MWKPFGITNSVSWKFNLRDVCDNGDLVIDGSNAEFSLAVVSFSFPMSLSLSIRPVTIYSFTQGLETKTKRLLKLSIYTLNSVSWKLATWDWMVFYVSNCSYMEFPKMNFLHVKKITVIPIFHSIFVSRLKHFPTNGRVSWGVGVVWVQKCEKVSNTSGV